MEEIVEEKKHPEYKTVNISIATHEKLKVLKALYKQSYTAILDELVDIAMEKVNGSNNAQV